MAKSIYDWSTTAASNDQSDDIINWRENQLPDTVNDSARSMMKRLAEFRDDLTGGLVTTGTQPAYTLTTSAQFAALADGRLLTCRIHATNTGPSTLNVNGLGAKKIRKFGSAGGMDVGVGDLQLGCVYQMMYSSVADSGAGAWVIQNPSLNTSGGFASGTAMVFAQATAPTGWTKSAANDDAALRVVSGSTGGTAGGTKTFSTAFTATRTATGTVDGTAITAAQMPAHAHTQQGYFETGSNNVDHYHWFPGGNYGSGGENTGHVHSCNMYLGDGGRMDGFGGNGTPTFWGGLNTNDRNTGHSHVTTVNGNTGGASASHIHGVTIGGATANSGSGAAHVHTFTSAAMDFAVKYLDTIVCTKD